MESVLLISNAHAGSASPRTKEVIIKSLQADFKLEVADTAARDHASELAADGVDRGFHAVVVFGGDGTINEVAQGLVGSDVSLGIIPGGTTNVMARSLGVPRNPVDATAFTAAHVRTNSKRRINIGQVGDRYFLFSAGMGLDAEVVRRAEMDPKGKRDRGEWLWVTNALKAGAFQYRGADPAITLEANGHSTEVVLAICCNGRPFTYFKRFAIDVCPEARLDGQLDVFGLRRLRWGTIPRIVWSVFVSRTHPRWRSGVYHHDVRATRFRARRPLPVQVDGDYIGERTEAEIRLVESALDLLV